MNEIQKRTTVQDVRKMSDKELQINFLVSMGRDTGGEINSKGDVNYWELNVFTFAPMYFRGWRELGENINQYIWLSQIGLEMDLVDNLAKCVGCSLRFGYDREFRVAHAGMRQRMEALTLTAMNAVEDGKIERRPGGIIALVQIKPEQSDQQGHVDPSRKEIQCLE